jgi:cell shape-determining protein MreD
MPSLVLLLVGAVGQLLAGALARFVPGALCPDVTLLVCVALALRVGDARALLAAAALGYGADLLSGSPFGLSALLAVLAFALTRLADGSLELRRPLATAALVAALTPTLALAGLGAALFFDTPMSVGGFRFVGALVLRTVVNVAAAPVVDALALLITARTGDDDLARRATPLATGRRGL